MIIKHFLLPTCSILLKKNTYSAYKKYNNCILLTDQKFVYLQVSVALYTVANLKGKWLPLKFF